MIHTRACDVLGIVHPIVQAGMATWFTNAELVAAVSNAGGLRCLEKIQHWNKFLFLFGAANPTTMVSVLFRGAGARCVGRIYIFPQPQIKPITQLR